MYFIMLMISKRVNNQSLFQFYCNELDGVKVPYSTNSIDELKAKLTTLIQIYPKEQILVINAINFDLLINVESTSDNQPINLTPDEIEEIYSNAYKEVYME